MCARHWRMRIVVVDYSCPCSYASLLRTTPAAHKGFRRREMRKQTEAQATLLGLGDTNKGCRMAGGCQGEGEGEGTGGHGMVRGTSSAYLLVQIL